MRSVDRKALFALKASYFLPINQSEAGQPPGALVKIDPNFEPQGGQGPSGAGAAGAAGAIQVSSRGASGQASGTDKADLSTEAQQFAMLSSQAANVPNVRQNLVASLKSAVQNGTYTVSNQQIAQSMLRDFSSTG